MSQGYQAALGIDTELPVTRGFEFEQCTLAKSSPLVDTSGWRGTRSALATRTRPGLATISGLIDIVPLPNDLTAIMPWIMGSPTLQSPFTLGKSLAARVVQIDKVAAVYAYAGCYVRRATFRCRVGEPLRLRLELLAQAETRSLAGSFPAVSYAPGVPFLFSDTTLNLVGQSREVQEWSIVIDNHLQASFANTTTATRIFSRDRTVSLQCTHPFTADEVVLTDAPVAGSAGILRLANPAATLTFQFAALQWSRQSPTIADRNEITCVTHAIARKSNRDDELVVTCEA